MYDALDAFCVPLKYIFNIFVHLSVADAIEKTRLSFPA